MFHSVLAPRPCTSLLSTRNPHWLYVYMDHQVHGFGCTNVACPTAILHEGVLSAWRASVNDDRLVWLGSFEREVSPTLSCEAASSKPSTSEGELSKQAATWFGVQGRRLVRLCLRMQLRGRHHDLINCQISCGHVKHAHGVRVRRGWIQRRIRIQPSESR